MKNYVTKTLKELDIETLHQLADEFGVARTESKIGQINLLLAGNEQSYQAGSGMRASQDQGTISPNAQVLRDGLVNYLELVKSSGLIEESRIDPIIEFLNGITSDYQLLQAFPGIREISADVIAIIKDKISGLLRQNLEPEQFDDLKELQKGVKSVNSNILNDPGYMSRLVELLQRLPESLHRQLSF